MPFFHPVLPTPWGTQACPLKNLSLSSLRKWLFVALNSYFSVSLSLQGKARGSRAGLWVRGESQSRLGPLGKWAGRRGGLVIFFGIVSLALLCVGIQHVRLDTTLDSLWTPGWSDLTD